MRNRFEERFVIVLQAKSGTPIYKLSEEYGYPKNKLPEWGREYEF